MKTMVCLVALTSLLPILMAQTEPTHDITIEAEDFVRGTVKAVQSGGWADGAALACALAQYLPLEESERYELLGQRDAQAALALLDRLVKAMGSS